MAAKKMIAVLMFGCCGLLLGCDAAIPLPTAANTKSRAERDDQDAAEALAEKNSVAEARAWLAGDPQVHVLWKGGRVEISQLVADLYQAGASEVSVADISKEMGVEIAALLVVKLPADPEPRKKVLAIHNAFWKKYLPDADLAELDEFYVADEGQKFLLLNFDL